MSRKEFTEKNFEKYVNEKYKKIFDLLDYEWNSISDPDLKVKKILRKIFYDGVHIGAELIKKIIIKEIQSEFISEIFTDSIINLVKKSRVKK